MFINYGGTGRYIGDRKFVIENELGQSTYLRIRFILKNGYLSYQEIACILCRGELLERKMRGKRN